MSSKMRRALLRDRDGTPEGVGAGFATRGSTVRTSTTTTFGIEGGVRRDERGVRAKSDFVRA